MSPAERADVIVDFSKLPVGSEVYLINEGPDEPFGGGTPGDAFAFADPNTTGQVMKFKVVELTSTDRSIDPALLQYLPTKKLGRAKEIRSVSLNELTSEVHDGPVEAALGTVQNGAGIPLAWMDEITENPKLNATEIWEIYNFTMDAHPIHIHEVQFEVVNREINSDMSPFFVPANPNIGEVRAPEPWETGAKDTVTAYPGEITRVKARFDIPGLYVWHCHIVDHEDNEMMRPYFVGNMNPFPWPDFMMNPSPGLAPQARKQPS
jgi:FtsP/CotA-like multicopper oxidase with cupredoxin domain